MPLYHETQSWRRCAVHAANNVLQQRAFTVDDFERIANALYTSSSSNGSSNGYGYFRRNPHRSFWRLGDYDANVLIAALNERGYDAVFVDRRSAERAAEQTERDATVGLLLNIVSNSVWNLFGALGDGRHWLAVARRARSPPSADEWVLLDSQQQQQQQATTRTFRTTDALVAYIVAAQAVALAVRPL